MRDSARDAIGQTIRVGDKVAKVDGNRSVSIRRAEVVGFTDSSIRITSRWGDNSTCVSSGRIIKTEDQSELS